MVLSKDESVRWQLTLSYRRVGAFCYKVVGDAPYSEHLSPKNLFAWLIFFDLYAPPTVASLYPVYEACRKSRPKTVINIDHGYTSGARI
jgi:hypothetical protein